MPFTFEKLDVYQKSLKYIENIERLSENIKGKISYALLDQLQRAALSVALNIAEENGRFHKKDKLRLILKRSLTCS